jgi:chloride channel protein, CIC family
VRGAPFHPVGPGRTVQGSFTALPDIRHAAKWFGLAILIGVLAGLVSIVFFEALRWAVEIFTHRAAGFVPPVPGGDPPERLAVDRSIPPLAIMLVLVPAFGGLLAGLIAHFTKPDPQRGGTDGVLDAFHQRRGRFGLKDPIIRALSSVVVIGSGGAVGREGPAVSLGAAIGAKVADWFKLRAVDRRIALLVGAAAGFAAIFRAPLSGAIFAIESPYRNPEFEYPAFVPAIIGALASYATFAFVYGNHPVFNATAFALHSPLELPIYAVFGLVCAGAGILYVSVLRSLREHVFDRFFALVSVPVWLRPATGGLVLGLIVLAVPEVWGTGYGWVQQAIDGTLATPGMRGVLFLIGLAFAKSLATAVVSGSRGGEGVFGPAFYIGAMVGAGYGQAAHLLFPEIVTEPTAYVLVGMSGMFAGITKVPIAGLVMVCEITGSYGLLLPLVLVCSLAYVFTGRASVYTAQIGSRFESPAHLGAFSIDVLAPLVVDDAIASRHRVLTLTPGQTGAEVVKLLSKSRQQTFPVLNEGGDVVGVVTVDDLRDLLLDATLQRLVLVSEFMSTSFPFVRRDDPLLGALQKLSEEESEEIAILVPDGERWKLHGLLSREQILRTYRARLERLARGGADDSTTHFH